MPLRKDFYKDQEKLRKTRNAQRKRYYQKTAGYPNREWTSIELEMLFDNGLTDMELSTLIKRSVNAIQNKRSLLRKAQREAMKSA